MPAIVVPAAGAGELRDLRSSLDGCMRQIEMQSILLTKALRRIDELEQKQQKLERDNLHLKTLIGSLSVGGAPSAASASGGGGGGGGIGGGVSKFSSLTRRNKTPKK